MKKKTFYTIVFLPLVIPLILAICLYVVFAILVSTGVISLFNQSPHADMNDPAFRQHVERVTGFSFPDSIQWQNTYCDSWQDEIFYCKFTIPKKDLDTLFPSSKVTWVENDRSMLPITPSKHRWYNPEKLTDFKSFHEVRTEKGTGPPRPYLGIDVIADNSVKEGHEPVTVYFQYVDY